MHMETRSISRRNFLKVSGLAGTAFSLGFYLPVSAQKAVMAKKAEADNQNIELNAWIQIDTAGKVTLFCHRAEMGQGVYQAIPQIIAEELEIDMDKIDIVFAKGNREKYGSQVTGGSSSVRGSYKNLLKLGATAREMLVTAASLKWGVPASACYAESGFVMHRPSGKKFNFGELVTDASKLDTPANVNLKARSAYKIIGKPLPRRDTPLKTNGTAVFGLDKQIPGMLYAAVERNPRLRGVVRSFDDTAARHVPGVKNVLKTRMGVFSTYREGVAVVADSTWAALQGKKALKIEWDDSGFEHLDTEAIYKRMEENLQSKEGLTFHSQGDPDSIIEHAGKKLDLLYQTPYEAHSCMEPMNCTAHYQGDRLEIWGPIQAPEWVQDYISKEMGLPVDKIIINMTFLGGGFGRKAFMDYPHEAALISKEIGAPVQVIWTREDDTTQGPYRPGVSYRCQGVITDGEISAFKVKLAGQNNNHWRGGSKTEPNRSSSEGFLKPYLSTIRNLSISDIPFETPIPTMWWRSVYASTNGFAYESFMDELAAEAGKDPLDFRRHYLNDDRVHLLIDKLEAVSAWKTRKKNEGYGDRKSVV
jgi:isoquinoline 1-oxidoreductase beta subunit